MANETGRELVGVIIVDVLETAPVLTVNLYVRRDLTLTYRALASRWYTLRFAVAFLRHAHKPNVVALWYHPRVMSYYLQLSARWPPDRVTGFDGWQEHDGQAIT